MGSGQWRGLSAELLTLSLSLFLFPSPQLFSSVFCSANFSYPDIYDPQLLSHKLRETTRLLLGCFPPAGWPGNFSKA